MEAQLDELLEFFADPKPEVRQLATQHIFDFTGAKTLEDPTFKNYFQTRAEVLVKKSIELIEKDWYEFPLSAHNTISMLTNLASDDIYAKVLDKYPEFIKKLIHIITLPTSILADPICMLLSNMSKDESLAIKILKIENSVEDLTDVFVKGSQKKFNKHAEYHFLASVFANVTQFGFAREFFLKRSERDQLLPITRLMVFTEHPNLIRRGGVISAIKNCCFDSKYHLTLLEEGGDADILPYVLLPLCGSEPFDDEDSEGMPMELQLLSDDKQREKDSILRNTLLESLIMLTSTREAREILRRRKVYPVLRELHKFETDQKKSDNTCLESIDKIVQMLMREEKKEGDNEQEELKESSVVEVLEEEEEEDMAIEEIV